MENGCPIEFKGDMKQYKIDFQLAPPHIHRRNAAEREIQTCKNHFISGFSRTYIYSPIGKWEQLISECMITLNLRNNSMFNPDLSAYAYLFGPYDFNKSPLAPPGTCLIVHNKPGNHTSWGNNSTTGWYIGPSLHHYLCIQ